MSIAERKTTEFIYDSTYNCPSAESVEPPASSLKMPKYLPTYMIVSVVEPSSKKGELDKVLRYEFEDSSKIRKFYDRIVADDSSATLMSALRYADRVFRDDNSTYMYEVSPCANPTFRKVTKTRDGVVYAINYRSPERAAEKTTEYSIANFMREQMTA